uniref:PH domain-containing protein n=1 Tax=Caenorhabditis japonica TaxID=281687 RepID=A0A8R1EUS4_CAEJA
MDDGEQDEWVKALLAEAESSSDDSDEEAKEEDGEYEEAEQPAKREPEEEFNPFMCDFTND